MRVTSEGPVKITKATIDAVWRRRKAGERLIVRDKDCRGLALIVNATVMTWTYAYRPRGTDPVTGRRWPNRAATLGNPETHSPDDARSAANQIKGQAAAGADPVADKKIKAASEQQKRAANLGRLIGEYAIALPQRSKMRGAGLPSASYVAIQIAQVRFAVDAIAARDMPAANLSPADVRKLVDHGAKGTNVRSRFGALSRFLDWCQEAGYIPTNPCALISRARRPKASQPRSHYLAPEDLARLWDGSTALREPVWRDLVRFMIAIPCRRGEAARLDWSHVDMAAATWSQPSHLTKNRDPHRLYLHELALEVLRGRHKATNGQGLVFPSPGAGRPIGAFSQVKTMLDDAAKLHGWTWHDFRRSFATALGEAGISEAVADAILNHRQSATRGGVLGVYQRATRWPEQVRAMQLWGQLLASALNPGEADNKVVPMATRTG
jgi:integrase